MNKRQELHLKLRQFYQELHELHEKLREHETSAEEALHLHQKRRILLLKIREHVLALIHEEETELQKLRRELSGNTAELRKEGMHLKQSILASLKEKAAKLFEQKARTAKEEAHQAREEMRRAG